MSIARTPPATARPGAIRRCRGRPRVPVAAATIARVVRIQRPATAPAIAGGALGMLPAGTIRGSVSSSHARKGKTAYEQLVVLDAFDESESHREDVRPWLDGNDKPTRPIDCEHESAYVDTFCRAGDTARTATTVLDADIAEVRKRLRTDGNLPVAIAATAFRRPSTVAPPSSGLAY